MSPRPGTTSSQPRLTAWLCLGISQLGISSSHLRMLYSPDRVALDKTQMGADLCLHHPGNHRASTSSGQLQTTLEQHHPDSAQLILFGGQRLVVSGHSQSLQLTGLGKSLPLTCQQQSRLNYKRKVHSVHTKDTPPVPSLGDGGSCALNPTENLLHCATLPPRHRVKPALPHTQKHRQIAKRRRQRNTAQRKAQIKTPVLAGVAPWIERRPTNQRVVGLTPSEGTRLGCRPGPQ